MKRLVILVFSLVLSISGVRFLLGNEPLSLSVFLNLISTLDLDFSTTIESWVILVGNFESVGSGNFFENVYLVVVSILQLIGIPVAILFDLLSFVSSVLGVVVELLGFDIFTETPIN